VWVPYAASGRSTSEDVNDGMGGRDLAVDREREPVLMLVFTSASTATGTEGTAGAGVIHPAKVKI
jgi:hypothetical protein